MSDKYEEAADWFADAVQNAFAYMSEAKSANGVDIEELKRFDIAAKALRAQADLENPVPLTLQQLREMDGEPVWVEAKECKHVRHSGWVSVTFVEWDDAEEPREIRLWWFGNECEDTPQESEYGKTWLAYAHKPKEDKV